MVTLLYIHGLGGGADSRIPSILRDSLKGVRVVCRTYSFDPQVAHNQITEWVRELHPSLIIGESLGSLQAMRISGMPHIYVSPAPWGGKLIGTLAPLTRISGVGAFFNHIYKPRPGERQTPDFRYDIAHKYKEHTALALGQAAESSDYSCAFFGVRDHYRKWGIVNIHKWRKMFLYNKKKQQFTRNRCFTYKGSHFMEEEFIHCMLIPEIRETISRFCPDKP